MGHTSAARDITCRGLVRVRQQQQLGGSSSRRRGDGSLAALLDARNDTSRLHEDAWYFCVLQTQPRAAIHWFSLVGDDGDGDDDDVVAAAAGDVVPVTSGAHNRQRRDSVLLAVTVISHFEAVDASDKTQDNNEQDLRGSVLEFNGLRLEAEDCTFYMEDHVNGFSYVCEVESEHERAKWTTSVHDALRLALSVKQASGESSDATAASPSPLDIAPVANSSSSAANSPELRRIKRPLLRVQTSDLDDDDDAFGLLSLTKSVFSSAASDAAAAMASGGSKALDSNRCAPGVFAFNHIEIREEASEKDGECGEDDDDASSSGSTPRALEPVGQSHTRSLSSSGSGSSRSRVSQSASAPPNKHQCLRCRKRIGNLFRSAKVCSACDQRFCREHCNQYAIISSLPAAPPTKRFGFSSSSSSVPAKKLSLVCVDCLVRQKLLSSMGDLAAYYAQVVDAGGLARLVRWRFFAQKPKHDLAKHVMAWELGPLSLLAALFKYRARPFMFVVTLAQLVKNVEYCVETLDFYWPQLLQWGFVHLADAPPSVQTHYLFFLAATCRRSVHLAVRATWECIAAHWDAMTVSAFERGHCILAMLFFVTQVSYGEARGVLPQLLFAHAPAHQLQALEATLATLYDTTRAVYAVSAHESPYFAWLLARTNDEVAASSTAVRQQLFVHRDFLDPFPDTDDADACEQQQAALVARRALGHAHGVDASVRVASAPALHIFSDVMQLVRFLVDLTTFLKESTAVPSERKLQLPTLLREMLAGQHIRPDAYLPLVSIVAPLHRVVNVLVDEGTVFSTKARAPTLVVFEVVRSDSSDIALRECFRRNTNPHARTAVRHRQAVNSKLVAGLESALAGSRSSDDCTGSGNGSSRRGSGSAGDRFGSLLDVLNFLDANIVETYVADLAPPLSTDEDATSDSIFDDPDGLQLSLTFGHNGRSMAPPASQQSAEQIVGVDVNDSGGHEYISAVDGPEVEGRDRGDRERWTTVAAQQFAAASLSTECESTCPPCRFFGERFAQMQERVRRESRFAKLPGWSLLPVIAKSFDDMRQEVFVLQGLRLCQLIFQKHNLDLWLRYYSIVCAGKDCGLLEVITDAQSLDALKKKAGPTTSFVQIFQEACGRDPVTGQLDPARLETARQNFIVSMAAYSLFSYVFLIKDRHNGNILLDTDGHVVHIDFGFVLGIAPGSTFSLETAPFKLTTDMVDVIGQPGSPGFDTYKQLLHQGLVALHVEAKQLLSLVYLSSKDSSFPCFTGTSRARIIRRLERRLCVGCTPADIARTAARIVDKSFDHLGTKQYDWFQQLTNGIAP